MLWIFLQIFQLAVKLWAGIELVCEFIQAVEAFVDRFEVDRINSSTVHSVLFKCLRREASLTAEGNPEKRVKNFFSNIDNDVLELCSKFPCRRDEIVREYLKSLSYLHRAQDRRRKGDILSREDRVRLQYSPVRIVKELMSEIENSVRDKKSRSNLTVVPNDGSLEVDASCSHLSQETEENNTACVEDPADGKIIGTVENTSRRKETAGVDRRWELGLLLRMKEKIMNKTVKTKKPVVKRVVWGSNHIPEIFRYIIRSYSSSAFRFAALKSNRSYKPGD